jgi:hypothetical protein
MTKVNKTGVCGGRSAGPPTQRGPIKTSKQDIEGERGGGGGGGSGDWTVEAVAVSVHRRRGPASAPAAIGKTKTCPVCIYSQHEKDEGIDSELGEVR